MGKDVVISKALSWLLRHGAQSENLTIDKDGFVPLEEVLAHRRIKGTRASFEDVQRIVDTNDKKRFTLQKRDGRWFICANQGHSIANVNGHDLKLLSTREDLPTEIIHGTYLSKIPHIIASGGLSKMTRNHVHFASGVPKVDSDVISGMRNGCNALIYLDIDKILEQQEIKFYMSKNKVILSPGNKDGIVPTSLFLKVVKRSDNSPIAI
ncbi:BA75_02982T0 [Komagataella pastoris]|uniref:2'-phosphotransferase n=1 Tax=Komagataella pastoris TaxID=4922 RepID=A0A1B2JC31_PICPA|nr:BA75_02982T0 [Komagataella pastoris]